MVQPSNKSIAVVGATGLQGSAVSLRLLEEGWEVRALTRDPKKGPARALAALGADVLQADMFDIPSLERSFEGVHGVYSVQNHHISGYDGEIRGGKNVADAAKKAGASHLVYGSAGIGPDRTGIGSWDTKIEVEAHIRSLDLPLTILRPMAFMELMSERKFYPAASVWHLMPKIMGGTRPVGWLSVQDLGVIAGKVLADPGRFVGRDLGLVSDVKSIDECHAIWREVTGRPPRRFPMPVWLFERFSGTDETTMWKWLRVNRFDLDPQATLEIHPQAFTVREWLKQQNHS
jgi:uncharacterized protein YbjT (DUF2867 family)